MRLSERSLVGFILVMLMTGVFSVAFIMVVNGQSLGKSQIVGLWHLDEIKPDAYKEIAIDSSGFNHGIVGGYPPPELVEGKFDKALNFDVSSFIYIPISFLVGFPPSPEPIFIPVSTSLDIQKEVKIEAWINVQAFTDASYNNIVVKCTRTSPEWQSVTRIFGLAVKPGMEQNGFHIPQGALSGCIFTDSAGFNEIVTVEPVISLNRWIHVAFTRTSTGMHLYVNGAEQDTMVISGVQNPAGSILNGTEVYIGHDSEVIIDEVCISDLAPEETLYSQFDIGPNLLIAVVVVAVVFAMAWILRRAIQMWVIHSKPRN